MPPKRKAGQTGDHLTTAQGLRVPDTDHSLKAGARGPTLMEDFHLREKITHFDHVRIPERVVHARGAAAHGTFTAYGNAASATKAGFLQKVRETPARGAVLRVIGPAGGVVKRGRSQQIVERTFLTTRSIEYDAVVVAGGIPGFSVVLGEKVAKPFTSELVDAVGLHRVWDRA